MHSLFVCKLQVYLIYQFINYIHKKIFLLDNIIMLKKYLDYLLGIEYNIE